MPLPMFGGFGVNNHNSPAAGEGEEVPAPALDAAVAAADGAEKLPDEKQQDANDDDEEEEDDDEARLRPPADDINGRRKYAPRVKVMLQPEFEYLLRGMLDSVEHTNACAFPVAGIGQHNPWKNAFLQFYTKIATDCDIPQGKNRYHKYKDKVEELWTAMEESVQNGTVSNTHPLYRQALRQQETFRTVGSNYVKKRGRPRKEAYDMIDLEAPVPGPIPGDRLDKPGGGGSGVPLKPRASLSSTGAGAAAGPMDLTLRGATNKAAAAVAYLSSKRPGTDPHAPWQVMVDHQGGVPSGNASAALAAASTRHMSDAMAYFQEEAAKEHQEFLQTVKQSLLRLEYLLTNENQVPKLPSPLHDMLQLKLRTNDPVELALIEPYFHDALGKYLNQCSAQAMSCTHPAMLPNLLAGLDQLRQAYPSERDTVHGSIKYTYRQVMEAWLKLINPTLAASTTATPPPRKRKAAPAPAPPAPVAPAAAMDVDDAIETAAAAAEEAADA